MQKLLEAPLLLLLAWEVAAAEAVQGSRVVPAEPVAAFVAAAERSDVGGQNAGAGLGDHVVRPA